jgi:hypothetical protein
MNAGGWLNSTSPLTRCFRVPVVLALGFVLCSWYNCLTAAIHALVVKLVLGGHYCGEQIFKLSVSLRPERRTA